MANTQLPKHYYTISQFYKDRYGQKVYKLPVALPVTCPNRDGSAGKGGCTFCGEIGAGYENRPATMTVAQQLAENIAHIAPKYKAELYIPYYQNFSNTYLPVDRFHKYMEEGCQDNTVGLAIATRPDCIHPAYLEALQDVKERYHKDIYVELGLQTVNYHSLDKVNRGHGLAEFIDAVQQIKAHGLFSCAHMILNLPWDDMRDVVEGAKIISALGVDQAKLHALYIIKGTAMAQAYEAGELTIISEDEYVDRVIAFLRHVPKTMVMQRLIGRAPKEATLFSNWSKGWWRVQDKIDERMRSEGLYQGDACHYLGGPAVRQFIKGELDDGTDC